MIFMLGLVFLVLMAPLVYYLLFDYGLSVSTPTRVPPQPPNHLKLTVLADETVVPVALALLEVSGQVEVSGRAQGGDWSPALVGRALSADDRIRTAGEGRAVLSMPGVFTVEVDGDSEFQVNLLTDNVFRFLLQNGMISASVEDTGEGIFEVRSPSAAARTQRARFRMLSESKAGTAVGAKRGEVEVVARGRVVSVQAGFSTRVTPGSPPDDPLPTPKDMLLKVNWPRGHELSSKSIVVFGQSLPGSRVRIAGRLIPVDAKGRFRGTVTLQEGTNRLKIEAYDVNALETRQESPVLNVDTTPEPVQIETSPGMWKKMKSNP